MQFNDLILKHPGSVICVMGGAPSLERDLKKIAYADVWVSANEHGAKLREVDYFVAMDENHGTLARPMVPYLRTLSPAPIIGCYDSADYMLGTWPGCPKKSLSGLVALWCAWAMGAKVVMLAGMNAYNRKPASMRDAHQVAEEVPATVRVVSGPLASVWSLYDPKEEFNYTYDPPSALAGLKGADNSIKVRVRKPTYFRGQPVKKDDLLEGLRHEFRVLLQHKMVVEL